MAKEWRQVVVRNNLGHDAQAPGSNPVAAHIPSHSASPLSKHLNTNICEQSKSKPLLAVRKILKGTTLNRVFLQSCVDSYAHTANKWQIEVYNMIVWQLEKWVFLPVLKYRSELNSDT